MAARKRKRKTAHKKRRKAGHKRKRRSGLMPESVIRKHAHTLKRNKRALKIYKEVIG